MTLGDIIKDYRVEHGMSMDAFSEKSGISKAYISLLEKNKHPKTGKSIAPSIQCIKQAADAMNIEFNTLFSKIESDVSLINENDEQQDSYYLNEQSREAAQFLYDRPEYRVLFDATRKVKPEDIDFVKQMIERMTGEGD